MKTQVFGLSIKEVKIISGFEVLAIITQVEIN